MEIEIIEKITENQNQENKAFLEIEDYTKNISPINYENYHISQVFSVKDIPEYMILTDNWIRNIYWYTNINILNILVNLCIKSNHENILEIGPGTIPFPIANNFIGLNESIPNYISIDMNCQKIPFSDKHFDFIYTRHFLEDIDNPCFAINEIIRCAKSGFIETPSPIIEIMYGVDSRIDTYTYCGYYHHKYIIWSDMYNNTLYILPKNNDFLNNMIYDKILKKKLIHIANNYPVYWNNYFVWNNDINVVVYENDMDVNKYTELINMSIYHTINNTNYFLNLYGEFQKPRLLQPIPN